MSSVIQPVRQPAQSAPFVLRLLPSLTDLAFLIPVAIVFAGAGGAPYLLRDSDTGWHIRTGQWILKNWRVPHSDLFSFSAPGAPWLVHEWLTDAISAWIYNWGGLAGVVLASLLLVSLTSALLFRLVRGKCQNDFVALALTTLAIVEYSLHWLARPHLVTGLFFVLFLTVLDRLDRKFTKLWLALPALMVLWANLHGGFLAGMVLIACYIAGELLRALFEPAVDGRMQALRRAGRFASVGGLCALATLLNPNGFRLHAHVWNLVTDPLTKTLILEFQPFGFGSSEGLLVEFLILAGALGAFEGLRRKEFAPALMFVGWCHIALGSVRHLELFAIVAAPLAASGFDSLLQRLQTASVADYVRRAAAKLANAGAEFRKTDRAWRLHVFSALVLAAVAAALLAPAPGPAFRSEFDPRRFPVQAVDRLGAPVLSHRVFSTDQWGGYLIYRLYPSIRVFSDGRNNDFYSDGFLQSWVDATQAKRGWEDLLARFDIGAILLPVDLPLVRALKQNARWRVGYDDGTAILFEPAQGFRAPPPADSR